MDAGGPVGWWAGGSVGQRGSGLVGKLHGKQAALYVNAAEDPKGKRGRFTSIPINRSRHADTEAERVPPPHPSEDLPPRMPLCNSSSGCCRYLWMRGHRGALQPLPGGSTPPRPGPPRSGLIPTTRRHGEHRGPMTRIRAIRTLPSPPHPFPHSPFTLPTPPS